MNFATNLPSQLPSFARITKAPNWSPHFCIHTPFTYIHSHDQQLDISHSIKTITAKMYYDLNVPWSPDNVELPRTVAFLHERKTRMLQVQNTILINLPIQLDTMSLPYPISLTAKFQQHQSIQFRKILFPNFRTFASSPAAQSFFLIRLRFRKYLF